MQLLLYITYFTALHTLGHDWLPMQSSATDVTFMNDFAAYEMLAPPTHQFHETRERFTAIDYSPCEMLWKIRHLGFCPPRPKIVYPSCSLYSTIPLVV